MTFTFTAHAYSESLKTQRDKKRDFYIQLEKYIKVYGSKQAFAQFTLFCLGFINNRYESFDRESISTQTRDAFFAVSLERGFGTLKPKGLRLE